MAMVHIFSRGDDELTQRFEDAMYDIKDAAEEVCEIYEEMKSQFGERGGYGERSGQDYEQMGNRSGYRMRYRMGNRGGSMGERRGRR